MTPAAARPTCRTCVWWNTDTRRATLSAPCILTHAIQRPADTCPQHAPHTGRHALDPVCWRLRK